VPEPAASAESLVQHIVALANVGEQTTAAPGGDATQPLIDAERAAAENASTSSGKTPEAVLAMLATLDGLWAFSIPTYPIRRWVSGSWWLGPILSGFSPLFLNGLLTLIWGSVALHSGQAWAWLTIFAVTQAGALIAARVLWGRLVRDMPDVVRMLPAPNYDRELAKWIHSWCSIPLQSAVALLPAALGTYVLWLASPTVGPRLELGPVSYISVALTSFMGGLVLYVFIMATLILTKIQRCGPLILDTWEPASTPGLRTLSRGYIYCLCIVIVVAAGLEMVATRVPGYGESDVLKAFVIGFPIFAVLCGLFVGLLPHVIIAHLTYEGKTRTTAAIDESIGDFKTVLTDHVRLATLVWLRNQVSATPSLPMRAPWLVPLIAALVGPLLAFLLTLKL
jgi:hypothetical protein